MPLLLPAVPAPMRRRGTSKGQVCNSDGHVDCLKFKFIFVHEPLSEAQP